MNIHPRDVEIAITAFLVSFATSIRLVDATRTVHGFVALGLTVVFGGLGIYLDRHARPVQRRPP